MLFGERHLVGKRKGSEARHEAGGRWEMRWKSSSDLGQHYGSCFSTFFLLFNIYCMAFNGLPCWLSSKNPSAMQEMQVQSLGQEGPGGGNGNPFQPGESHGQRSLENPMDKGIWQGIVCRVTKSWTGLSMYACIWHFIKFYYSLTTPFQRIERNRNLKNITLY